MVKIVELPLMKLESKCGTLPKRFKMNKLMKKVIVEGEKNNVDFIDKEDKSLEIEIASNFFKNRVVS